MMLNIYILVMCDVKYIYILVMFDVKSIQAGDV